LLGVGQFLGILGRLGHVPMQLRNGLTFTMPSPATLSISDSADLKQNLACLPSMWKGREGMLTSAWRFITGVALWAPEIVLRQWFSTLWSSSPAHTQRNGNIRGGEGPQCRTASSHGWAYKSSVRHPQNSWGGSPH
jgi:hypothetical protein